MKWWGLDLGQPDWKDFVFPQDFEKYEEFKEFEDISDFEHYWIIKMYQDIFNHFENIGQLAVVRTYYRSSIETTTIICNIILKILEKKIINPQAESIINKGIFSLKIIGMTASNENMKEIIIEIAKSHRMIGDSADKKNLESLALKAFKGELYLRPDFAEAWENIGDFYKKLNNFEESLESYKEALEIKRDTTICYECI